MPVREQQAAPMRAASKLFGVSYSHMLRAEKRGELTAYGTGEGRCSVVLFEDVRAWLRQHPTRRAIKQEKVP